MFNNFFLITLSKCLFHFSFVFVLHFNGRSKVEVWRRYIYVKITPFILLFLSSRKKFRASSGISELFVEFQAFPWDFQSILSKHKGLHEGHGNCVLL